MKKLTRSDLIKVLLILLSSILWGCSEEKNSTSPPSFTSIYTQVLVGQACVDCHSPGGDNNGSQLDFSTQALAFSTLTNLKVTGATSVGTCGDVFIVGETPDTSFLAAVLFDDYYQDNFAGVAGCTPYNIHLSNQSLTDSEKANIIGWIQAGAPNN